jgi:LAO/AO transport system kinase
VAVLAVDPSSTRSGGSILGDKTRMTELSRRSAAYIRPSPSRGTLGGVARRTREAMLVCEAAGFDTILVETVGVGQSEVAVADLVDLFMLIASPAGGDELQGIKRGIMELADLVVVNKSDGELAPAAQRAVADLRSAVQLLRPKRPGWVVEVDAVSALTGAGIPGLWERICSSVEKLRSSGALAQLRADQAVAWMWTEIREDLLDVLRTHPQARSSVPEVEAQVRAGELGPSSAAARLLSLLT